MPLLALLTLLLLVAGCGSESGASNPTPAASPPAFADESFAELATDGQKALWLAVSGYRRNRDFGLRVFRRHGPGWAEVPSPPEEASSDLPISLVVQEADGDSRPCIGYSEAATWKPVLSCLVGDEWMQESLPASPGAQLVEVGSDGERLIALVVQRQARTSAYRLFRQEGGGKWKPTPPLRMPPAIAKLAIEGARDGGTPAIGFATQGRSARHYAFELRNGRWLRLRPSLRRVGTGPLVGGPVMVAERVVYPVNEADSEPWVFSVASGRIGSAAVKFTPISTGSGNAQGRLDLVGGRIWATWQEDRPRKDGRFQAAIYAAELDSTGKMRRKVRLWRGLAIGPGSTQVVEFRGKAIALFMPASSNGRGLQATVRTLG